MIEIKLIPHNALHMVYKVGDTINSHAFSGCRYQYEICRRKPVEREHGLTWRRINQNEIVGSSKRHYKICQLCFISWIQCLFDSSHENMGSKNVYAVLVMSDSE